MSSLQYSAQWNCKSMDAQTNAFQYMKPHPHGSAAIVAKCCIIQGGGSDGKPEWNCNLCLQACQQLDASLSNVFPSTTICQPLYAWKQACAPAKATTNGPTVRWTRQWGHVAEKSNWCSEKSGWVPRTDDDLLCLLGTP